MCGIFGIYCDDFSYYVSEEIYQGLMALQHRGQLFAGISTSDCKGNFSSYKNRGLVSKVLNPKRLKTFFGNVGIGHICYNSRKCTSAGNAQPYHFKSVMIEFSLAINGTITNYDEIYKRLRSMGRIFSGNSDVELIATLIETLSNFSESMVETLKKVIKIIKGALSLIILVNDGTIYAMKDSIGYNPLCYGTLKINNRKFFIISSESCGLDALGATLKGELNPGTILKISHSNGLEKHKTEVPENLKGICQFEYVYFARPDSIIDGISVADVRYNLGRNLAKMDDFQSKDAIVIPIPDSGRSAAMGYAWESGLTYQEGLMKNRYIWQIKSDVSDKLNPIKEIIKDKDIILVDDSIISGNTIKIIIEMIKKAGAKSVNVRISCPPIIKNCKINNSISNRELLIAYQTKVMNYSNFNEEMRKYIRSDTLMYQTINGLIDAIGLGTNKMCFDCLKEFCDVKEERELDTQTILERMPYSLD